jgi:hypothetical protein
MMIPIPDGFTGSLVDATHYVDMQLRAMAVNGNNATVQATVQAIALVAQACAVSNSAIVSASRLPPLPGVNLAAPSPAQGTGNLAAPSPGSQGGLDDNIIPFDMEDWKKATNPAEFKLLWHRWAYQMGSTTDEKQKQEHLGFHPGAPPSCCLHYCKKSLENCFLFAFTRYHSVNFHPKNTPKMQKTRTPRIPTWSPTVVLTRPDDA